MDFRRFFVDKIETCHVLEKDSSFPSIKIRSLLHKALTVFVYRFRCFVDHALIARVSTLLNMSILYLTPCYLCASFSLQSIIFQS